MDEIKQRLSEAADACIKTYEAWRGKSGDAGAREALQDAVHELRKVAARLEIELAVSDRKQHGNEPIPIPAHRAARRQGAPEGSDFAPMEDEAPRMNPRPMGGFGGQGGNNPRRNVQIRRPSEGGAAVPAAAAAPAAPAASEAVASPETAPAGEEDGQRRSRPLSLRRTPAAEPDAS